MTMPLIAEHEPTGSELLTFAEAAILLGVDAEKVRRLVVEDGALRPIYIRESDGAHLPVNISGLLSDGEGGIVVGNDGALRVTSGPWLASRGVSTTSPLGGHLRIYRADVECALKKQAATTGAEVVAVPASRSSERLRKRALPPGLSPAALAQVLAGLGEKDEDWWRRLIDGGKSVWLMNPPVLMHRGTSGSLPGGTRRTSTRNPVEVARYLLDRRRVTLLQMMSRFDRLPSLEPWRAEWDAFLKEPG